MKQVLQLPPHSNVAEESVIGSLILDGGAIGTLDLTPADFYHEPCKLAYTACLSLKGRKVAINQITLAEELTRQNQIETAGGVAYLSHCIGQVPTSLELPEYAGIVRSLARRRAQIALGQRLIDAGHRADPDSNPVDEIQQWSADYQRQYRRFEHVVSPRQQADELMELLQDYTDPERVRETCRWGFRDLDNLMGGIYPGELTIIGARPSVGKTQLLLDIAANLELQEKSVLFVTAEMITRHLLERRVSRLLRKSVLELRRGNITDEDMQKVAGLAGSTAESKTHILPQGVSSRDVYTQAAKLRDTVGLDVVFVDYLQRLSDCYGSAENQNVRVSRASKVLTELATEMKIPVICASQLNRASENRADPLPTLSDLRDSGSIEQDAFNVILAFRYIGTDGVNDGGEKDPRILRLKIAKGRQTGTGVAELKWLENEHRYVDYQGG